MHANIYPRVHYDAGRACKRQFVLCACTFTGTHLSTQKMGYASAMAWLLFIIIALLTFINFKLANKWGSRRRRGMKKNIRISRILVYTVFNFGRARMTFFLFSWLIRFIVFIVRGSVCYADGYFFRRDCALKTTKKLWTAVPFARYFFNTLFLVVLNGIGNIFSSSMAAFGFSRIKFKGRNLMFGLVISTMMLPGTVLLIPQFFGWKLLGAYDTFYPLFVQSFFINAFFIFLLRQFFHYTAQRL